MAEALDSWEAAAAFALTLPGSELARHYGQPAVKIAANGRAFLNVGHESDTSFVVQIDLATVDTLLATAPESFWQTPHYAGYGAVLVRYASPDPARVRAIITRAHAQAAAKTAARARKA